MPSSLRHDEFSEIDQLSANTIRILAAEMVQTANSGHPGMPMGFAMAAHVLWSRFLRFDPDYPLWHGRDRFVLSAGHGSALQYILLHLAGYDLSLDDLKKFRQMNSFTPGHPEMRVTPGVETTTGPLGQGIGNAVGMAVGQRYIREQLGLHDTSGFDPLDHHIYVVCGDGDLQEGLSSEAISFAGRQKLNRLVLLYDDNRITIDGDTDLAWSENVLMRFAANEWHTLRVDGNDPQWMYRALQEAKNHTDAPSLIAVRTHIGFGSPGKQDTAASHGAPLGEDELRLTRENLKWSEEPFTIPEAVYSRYTETAEVGRKQHKEWEELLASWLNEETDRRELWEHLVEGKQPAKTSVAFPEITSGEAVATRVASGKALNVLADHNRSMIGGCADLMDSVKTRIVSADPFLPEHPGGRNIYYGVREHAMGSITNGICEYGALRPFAGTFLIFSDYMRPAIRMAALMRMPVIYVFSHDSIGVGEDGPTHQPIEHYASLRSIPYLTVIRPADAEETRVAWQCALENSEGPTAILTTRQKAPFIDHDKGGSAEGLRHGAYTLCDCEGVPELILIGSGSELHLCVEAWQTLAAEGRKVRVVSMPSWELFDQSSEDYQESVLPKSVTKRLSVEAGVSQGWARFVGPEGTIISIDRFGRSAPSKHLFEFFGFTTENILAQSRSLLSD